MDTLKSPGNIPFVPNNDNTNESTMTSSIMAGLHKIDKAKMTEEWQQNDYIYNTLLIISLCLRDSYVMRSYWTGRYQDQQYPASSTCFFGQIVCGHKAILNGGHPLLFGIRMHSQRTSLNLMLIVFLE